MNIKRRNITIFLGFFLHFKEKIRKRKCKKIILTGIYSCVLQSNHLFTAVYLIIFFFLRDFEDGARANNDQNVLLNHVNTLRVHLFNFILSCLCLHGFFKFESPHKVGTTALCVWEREGEIQREREIHI